jgi:hypothetical protein
MKRGKWPSIDTLVLSILGTASAASVTNALGALTVPLAGRYLLSDTTTWPNRLVESTRWLYTAKLVLVMPTNVRQC